MSDEKIDPRSWGSQTKKIEMWLRGEGYHTAADALYLLQQGRGPDGEERPAVVAMDKAGHTETPERMFLRDVERELSRARDKFPSSEGCMTALTEEVGELAKAMLDEPGERIYKEAVQTAVMAARVALEGDRSLENYRINRHGADVGRARGVRP